MANTETQVGAGAATGAAAGAPAGPWGMAIGGVAGGAMAYMNAASQAKSDKERRALLEKAAQEFRNIKDPETQAVVYEQLKSVGVLTPQEEQVYLAPSTELANVSVDPRLKDAQYAALAKLSELGQGGLDTKDLADIERAKQQYRQEQQGQQEAIQEGMARRGIASSGMESLMRQQAAQGSADQMLNYEQQTQGAAQRRALEAIMQQGNMAGNVRTQDYNEQAKRAEAQDAIARFNAQMQSNTQSRNVANDMNAQTANLNREQAIADYNASLAAKNAAAGNLNAQQGFQNTVTRVQGAQGMAIPQATMIGQAADREAQTAQSVAGAAGKGATAYGAYQTNKGNDPWATKKPVVETTYSDVESQDFTEDENDPYLGRRQ